MRRWISHLAILIALYTANAAAHPLPSCTMHHEVIHAGDSAPLLAQRAGVRAGPFADWLSKARPSTLRALHRLRPGDIFDVCVTHSPKGESTLSRLDIVRDARGRKVADHALESASKPIVSFADVSGDVLTAPAPHPSIGPAHPISSLAARSHQEPGHLLIKPLKPGLPLGKELSKLLGHNPVVAATIAYAKKEWHLPERIPRDSHCTLALWPSRKLAYLQVEYHGSIRKAYYYADDVGHDFIVGPRGHGYEVIKPLKPVRDARMSSGWGWRVQPVLGGNEFHQGIDYAAPRGTPVRAAMDGVVSLSEWRGEYGRVIELKHANGLATRYGHLSAFAKSIHPGRHVHRGDIIGYVGSTGLSTGPHLYYEVWDHGVRVNPLVHTQWALSTKLDIQEQHRLGAYIDRIKAAP